ncbi:MAG: hypothetical protein RQ824_03740 [bacterium]|nr:hypothetical protein [bacterium]
MMSHTPPPEYDKKENAKRLREGLENHIRFVSEKAVNKYGRPDSMDVLSRILEDAEIVRFPTSILFDVARLGAGEAVKLEKTGDGQDESYQIIVHPVFEEREKDIIILVLQEIVKVNYGKIAKEKESLLFASSLLGMEEDAYQSRIKELSSEIS